MKRYDDEFCVVCLQNWDNEDVVSLFYFLVCLEIYSFFSHCISDTCDAHMWTHGVSRVLSPVMTFVLRFILSFLIVFQIPVTLTCGHMVCRGCCHRLGQHYRGGFAD